MFSPHREVVLDGELSLDIQMDGDMSLDIPIDGEAGTVIKVNEGGGALRPATTERLGSIIVGEDLAITQSGVLSVIKADRVEQDNTHPITSAAVHTEIGNIDAILRTI